MKRKSLYCEFPFEGAQILKILRRSFKSSCNIANILYRA